MTKQTGTVKWFSNRKGFGFIAPKDSDEEIFVHHSDLVFEESVGYRTLADGSEVEFDTETDDTGKTKATKVSQVGGAPLVSPPPKKRKPRNPAAEKEGGNQETEMKEREPPFHDVVSDAAKEAADGKGIKLVRNTVDVAFGDLRIKLGQGGYTSLVDASAKVAEGSFACDVDAKITFTWERCLELVDGAWKSGDASKLLASLSLTEDDVGAVSPDETLGQLWGEETPDPKDLFEENGFKMKRVLISRPPPRRNRYRGRRKADE